MSRSLNGTLAAALSDKNIMPVMLVALQFASGPVYAWSGIGPLTFNGNTYQGVGALGKISPVTESSQVQADGINLTLSGLPIYGLTLPDAASPTPPTGITAPMSIPDGQLVAYAYPTDPTAYAPASFACFGVWEAAASASADDEGGTLSMSGSCSQGWPASYIQWAGFKMPNLPFGSVISAIYPAVYLNGTHDNVYHTLTTGGNTGGQTINSFTGTYSGQFPETGSVSSLGDTQADVEAAFVQMSMAQSSPGDGYADTVLASNPVLAIYYTAPTAVAEPLHEFARIEPRACDLLHPR